MSWSSTAARSTNDADLRTTGAPSSALRPSTLVSAVKTTVGTARQHYARGKARLRALLGPGEPR